MRKLIFILLLFLSFGTQVYADSYLLVMSKDDKVGQHMLKLINQDMGKHGKFIPENHKEYNQIKWDNEIFVFNREYEVNIYDEKGAIGEIAVFDINNDGKNETVLFSKFLHAIGMIDSLQFLPLEYYPRFKKKIYNTDFRKDRHILPGSGPYLLKEFPSQRIDNLFGRLKQRYIDIGHRMYIRPLKIDSKYYISLFGSMDQNDPNLPLDQNNIIVISQYDQNNQLHDIGYFIRAYDRKTIKGDK